MLTEETKEFDASGAVKVPFNVTLEGCCSVPGCDPTKKRYARGLCKRHYDLWRKKDPNWRRLIRAHRAGPLAKFALYIKKSAFDALRREAKSRGVTRSFFMGWILENWVRDNLLDTDPNIGESREEFELSSDEAILRAVDRGELTRMQIAQDFGVSDRTVYRAIRRREQEREKQR